MCFYIVANQLFTDNSKPILLQDKNENLSILPHIEVLYPDSQVPTFEQVSSPEFSSQFVSFDKEKNLFPEKNVVWVRFTLQNQSNDDHWLLDLGTQYDSAALYFTDNQQRMRGYTDGSRLLKESKVKYYGFFNYLPLDIPKNATQTYYLLLEIYKPITLQNRNTLKNTNNLVIQNESIVASNHEQSKYFGSAFAGIYLIMAFYSFVLFFNLKDRSYLYFGFLLLASCLTTLFPLDTFVGFLGFNKMEESYFYFTLTPLPWLFALFFTRSYLRLWEYAPFWNKVSWGIFGLIVLYYLLCIFNIWVAIIIIIITISCVIVALVAGIVVVMRGYKPARYFLLANVFYLGGRIISALAIFYVINSKFLMLNATTIGGVIQVFLFSVGLFYRLQEIQKDLVKEKEERQKLIESQKENLEAEVKERTKEIQQQRRILKEKNEELQSSEEELRQNMEELETNQEVIKNQRDILEKAFAELEQKNLRITDSICYAQRIQNALLPHEDVLATHFQEHFVIFKPKRCSEWRFLLV